MVCGKRAHSCVVASAHRQTAWTAAAEEAVSLGWDADRDRVAVMAAAAAERRRVVVVGVLQVWVLGVAAELHHQTARYHSNIARHSVAAASPDQRAQWVEAVVFAFALLLLWESMTAWVS